MQVRRAWLTYVILGAGMLLRVALAATTPPERAYDDHYEPLKVVLEERRLPHASACWECYQPPAYYLLSAAVYTVIRPLAAESVDTEQLARRCLQGVSVAAGCATLVVCLLIFRRLPALATAELPAMALIAFLPRHLYMSAMATNDALTYFLASCAVYAACRANEARWPVGRSLLAGALAGAAVLSKGYGWVTVAAILLSTWWFTRRTADTPPRSRLARELPRPLLLVLAGALALAIWPTVRTAAAFNFERLHVDNFALFDNPLRFQPPGSIGETSFTSFRFLTLLDKPWLHRDHADSFWTQAYARLWFDYEGEKTTLAPYPPWQALWERCAQEYPRWNRQRWDILLSYAPDEVPPRLRAVAVTAYLAGLPLTLGVLAGAGLAIRRMRQDFPLALLSIHALLALLVPVVQTLRLPHFCAMKMAFALSGLTSAAVFLALLLVSVRRPAVRRVLYAAVAVALGVIALSDLGYLCLRS